MLPSIFKTSRLFHVGGDEFIVILLGDDYDNIDEYLKTFIKDSIYITKEYIYFVTNNDSIKKYYGRYKTNIRTIKCSDKYIYVIDTKEAKNNKIKELFYGVVDSVSRLIDIITNLLLS